MVQHSASDAFFDLVDDLHAEIGVGLYVFVFVRCQYAALV
jgi:hypothetical protein